MRLQGKFEQLLGVKGLDEHWITPNKQHGGILLARQVLIFISVQVAILVTDGIQTTDQGPYMDPGSASKALQYLGVRVYSFGIGDKINPITLLRIASHDQKQVIRATDFKELEAPAKRILASVCPSE